MSSRSLCSLLICCCCCCCCCAGGRAGGGMMSAAAAGAAGGCMTTLLRCRLEVLLRGALLVASLAGTCTCTCCCCCAVASWVAPMATLAMVSAMAAAVSADWFLGGRPRRRGTATAAGTVVRLSVLLLVGASEVRTRFLV